MATTVDDIARAAGVSRRTVCRALHNKGRISDATKARVVKIAEEMDYHPNLIARSLMHGRSELIGVVASNSVLAIWQPFIEPIERSLREHGFSMLFYTSIGDQSHDSVCLRELIERRVAGAIIAPEDYDEDPEPYKQLLNRGIRVVLVDKNLQHLDVPQFIPNPYQTTLLATEHLISLGHRHIVHLAIPETSYIGREKGRGFREAMAKSGIPTSHLDTVITDFGEESGADAMRTILKRRVRPTAVIARHDRTAIGAMRVILDSGLSIPDDISVVGNGDIWPCDMLRVPLTTIRHPLKETAEAAIRSLLALVNGENVDPGTRLMDVSLVQRSSCAPPKP